MNSSLYDIYTSYDDNWEKGPPLLKNGTTKPKRKIKKTSDFLGFNINVPFGIPAGPLLNAKFVKAAFDYGFDVVHYKTQRSIVFPCNEYPNVLFVEVDGDLTPQKAKKPLVASSNTQKDPKEVSITNSFGNPSRGPEIWQEDMKKAISYEGPGQLVVASAVGTIKKDGTEEDYYNDFAFTARLAKETGVKIIEINLSCPNVATEGVLCYTPHAVAAICRKTKEAIGNTPLLAKLGYFTEDQKELLVTVVTAMLPFVQGIAVINTIAAPVVDQNGKQALPGLNRLSSGICGASIKWAGIDMTKKLARLREKMNADFAIIGVGGVMSPADYFEYRKAGADLVQSATGAMWNPYLAYEIWQKENERDTIISRLRTPSQA